MGTIKSCYTLFWANPESSIQQNKPFLWLFTSYFMNHSRKTSKAYQGLQEKQGQTLKQHSLMDSYTWTHQWWPTCKNLHLSTLYRHWSLIGTDGNRLSKESMPSGSLDDNDHIYIYVWIDYMNISKSLSIYICIYIYIYIINIYNEESKVSQYFSISLFVVHISCDQTVLAVGCTCCCCWWWCADTLSIASLHVKFKSHTDEYAA